ncbi:11254_t:CDS:2 [Paraglomus occultum]|uniref:11254_t:CDS:1 n=1 Tax=Paraglomus occultum TaxID=144539 RepID=A0A9N8VZD6_9GLOM|nr:11254_t:CDS:2 [Paraglomus occultum]
MSSIKSIENLPNELVESIVDYAVECDRFSCEYHIQGPRKRQLMQIAFSCKKLCRAALKILWRNKFDGDFNLASLKLLLGCLSTETKQLLSIDDSTPAMPYDTFINSISLEKLFRYVDEWLEKQGNSQLEKRKEVARELLRLFKSNEEPLEKLRCVGFHENRVWVTNYQVILEPEFNQWIENIHILDIRGTFDFTDLVDTLVSMCTNISSVTFSFYCFGTTPFVKNITTALKLIEAQQALRVLSWSGIQGMQRNREDSAEENERAIYGNDPTEILANLVRHRFTLRELRLAHMDFTNIDLLGELALCQNLQLLTFEYCSNIRARAIEPMMNEAYASLEKIEIINCVDFQAMEDFARDRGVLQNNRDSSDDNSDMWS